MNTGGFRRSIQGDPAARQTSPGRALSDASQTPDPGSCTLRTFCPLCWSRPSERADLEIVHSTNRASREAITYAVVEDGSIGHSQIKPQR